MTLTPELKQHVVVMNNCSLKILIKHRVQLLYVTTLCWNFF